MKINYYKTYIDTIKGSVGSKQYRNFWINKGGKEIDICQDGNLSCAYYVSNVLKQFNLIDAGSVNVGSTEKLLLQRGRQIIDSKTQQDQIPIGSVIIYKGGFGQDGFHTHIGFYMGNEIAISNNSRQETQTDQEIRVIAQHHYTYNGTREITNIYTYDFENKIDWLFHEELEVKICGQTEGYINDQGLNNDELERSLGKNDGLKSGRLCGLACVLSAINYYNNQIDKNFIDKKLSDLIDYRKEEYSFIHPLLGIKTKRAIFTESNGRAHGGLVYIAEKNGIKGKVMQEDMSNMIGSQIISMIYNNIKENKLTILSVDIDMGSGNFSGRKGGHLVMILGIDYNGSEYSLMILNPLYPKYSQRVNIDRFIQGFGGKGMLLYN